MKSSKSHSNVLLKDNCEVNIMSASARRTLELFYIKTLTKVEFENSMKTTLNESKTKINEFKRK